MNNRLLSLDVFRGITVAGMILVNNPGDWGHIYAPLEHAKWNGCTPTDLVFPFFLFIVGVSITYALDGRQVPVSKLFKRSLILFGLGVFLSLYPKFDFPHVRIMGVLQRIGIVFFLCSVIYIYTNRFVQIGLVTVLLLGYYFLMTYLPVPDTGVPSLDAETNLGAWLDRTILTTDHLWKSAKVWDPEGLLSTVPAIGTGLLGVLTGQILKAKMDNRLKILRMILIGLALVAGGLYWNRFFPINKSLWTSSYVLFTGGWAMVGLAVCFWIVDVKNIKSWALPFIVFGVNAITVFFLSGIIPRTLGLIKIAQPDGSTISSQKWLHDNFVGRWFSSPYNASLAGALTFLAIWFVILYIMYRKKIFIKI
jgi:predicted acyltransferase